MKKYKDLFSSLNRTALIPFFVIGDPDYETSLEIVKTAVDNGADILELGIPFSDPIADGPTIQKADIRAINNGMNVRKARKFIREIKEYRDIPIGLLMYYNLVYQYGTERFFKDFSEAGVNSVLVADLNINDGEEIIPYAEKYGLDTVFMVTPNTEPERMKKIVENTTGFIYTVSVLGVTGSRNELSDTVEGLVKKLKGITKTPVCVGFGVSTPEHAATIAKAGADGVIIGSRLVKIIEADPDDKNKITSEIAEFLHSVKTKLEQL